MCTRKYFTISDEDIRTSLSRYYIINGLSWNVVWPGSNKKEKERERGKESSSCLVVGVGRVVVGFPTVSRTSRPATW